MHANKGGKKGLHVQCTREARIFSATHVCLYAFQLPLEKLRNSLRACFNRGSNRQSGGYRGSRRGPWVASASAPALYCRAAESRTSGRSSFFVLTCYLFLLLPVTLLKILRIACPSCGLEQTSELCGPPRPLGPKPRVLQVALL